MLKIFFPKITRGSSFLIFYSYCRCAKWTIRFCDAK